MKILKRYEEAIELVKPFLTEKKLSNPWSENFESAETTFKYIFDLSHNCYILLSPGNELLKFEFSKTSPMLKKYLTIRNIPQKQRKTFKSKEWRIMQCVIKPFTSTGGDNLFPKFIKNIQIPHGVYILSLNDSQLLRKDFYDWFGKEKIIYKPPFLPMFSYSGHVDYFDMILPTRDDIDYAMNPFAVKQVPWSEKMDVAVFRGSLTGCKTSGNQRVILARMRNALLDVGLTKTSSRNYRYDEGVSELKADIDAVQPLDMFTEQIKYKYIIHVDGNVLAYRLLTSMLTGSLIIRVKSPYIHWLDNKMVDGKHYIAVKEDLSDLREKRDWCIEHDAKCKKIAEAGKKLAEKYLDLKVMEKYVKELFIV